VQARAAAAVCLQALAVVGLVKPCWFDHGFDRPEPPQALQEGPVEKLVWERLGLRQLVAHLPPDVNQQVGTHMCCSARVCWARSVCAPERPPICAAMF
jgi:hypothetical protein